MSYCLASSAASSPARQMALAQPPPVTSSLLTGNCGYHWEQLQHRSFGQVHRKWVQSISQTKLGNWQIDITSKKLYFIIIENKYVWYLQPMQLENCWNSIDLLVCYLDRHKYLWYHYLFGVLNLYFAQAGGELNTSWKQVNLSVFSSGPPLSLSWSV